MESGSNQRLEPKPLVHANLYPLFEGEVILMCNNGRARSEQLDELRRRTRKRNETRVALANNSDILRLAWAVF